MLLQVSSDCRHSTQGMSFEKMYAWAEWGLERFEEEALEALCFSLLCLVRALGPSETPVVGPCPVNRGWDCNTAHGELWDTNILPDLDGLELLLPQCLWGEPRLLRTGSFDSPAGTKPCLVLHPQCPLCPWVQALIEVLCDSSLFSRPLGLVKPDRKCRNVFSCLNPSQACFEDYLEITGRQAWQKKFPQFEPWLGLEAGQRLNPIFSNLKKCWGI